MTEQSARILVADENEIGRCALANCLREAGHTVHEAASGRECLDAVSTHTFDIIVLDVKLPDINGIEICRRLKANPQTADLAIIQLSAHFTSTDHRISGLESGADAYLTLPLDVRELLAYVRMLLRARQTEERRQRAEEALRKSEEKFAKAFIASPSALVISRMTDGTILEINDHFLQLFGLSREEVVGRRSTELGLYQDVNDRERLLAVLRREGHVRDFEIKVRTLHNDVRSVTVFIEPLVVGNEPCILTTLQDMTDRKKAEIALQHTTERFALLSHTAAALLVSPNPQEVVEDLCRKVMAHVRCDVFFNFLADEESGKLRLNACAGIAPAEVEKLGWLDYGNSICGCVAVSGQRIIAEDIRQSGDHRADLVRSYGVQAYCCHPLMAGDRLIGTLSFGSRSCTAFPAEDVELMRVVADQVSVAIDRIQTGEALRRSESFFRQTLESIPGMVFTARADGSRDYQSQQWVDYTGVPLSDCVGGGWTKVVHPADQQRAFTAWRTAVETRTPYDLEYRVRRADGQYEWFKVIARPILDPAGHVVRWLGVAANINELKTVEAALRHSEERLAMVLHAGQLGFWDWDVPSGQTFFGGEWASMLGYDLKEIEPSVRTWEKLVHPDDKERVARVLNDHLEGRTEFYECEHRLLHKDGSWRWIMDRGRVVERDAQGKPLRALGTHVDTTARKRAEDALQNSQLELERIVAERTAKLQELVAELEHFSYTITHDMRAPLRSMRGFAELVSDLCSPCQKADKKRFLDRIIASADRMDLLITDALSYSQAVRQQLPLSSVDVNLLLRGMLDSYPEFQASKARIHFRGGIPMVIGNQAGLTQCFSNLLGNAIKFVQPGKVPEIRIWAESSSAPPAAPGGIQTSNNWVRIWVEDQGIGISENMRGRVFQMFTRGDGSYEGTGIGLALVRKVVDRMGGRVGVESELGRGSRFWIELESADSPQSPPCPGMTVRKSEAAVAH